LAQLLRGTETAVVLNERIVKMACSSSSTPAGRRTAFSNQRVDDAISPGERGGMNIARQLVPIMGHSSPWAALIGGLFCVF
jgi:hypothetical protein